jgi:hypothetical protein
MSAPPSTVGCSNSAIKSRRGDALASSDLREGAASNEWVKVEKVRGQRVKQKRCPDQLAVARVEGYCLSSKHGAVLDHDYGQSSRL